MEHCVISPSPKTIVSAALPARAISIFENNNFFEINPLEITSSSGHSFVYPPIDPDLGKIVILSTDSIPFLTADTIALPTSL